MATAVLYTITSVIIVSAVSLIGVFTLLMRGEFLYKCVSFIVALAIGALLGDAFIHLIPQSFAGEEHLLLPALLILAGIYIFFIVEKLFKWHHGHHTDGHKHQEVQSFGKMILVSDGLHNMLDGMIIGASYLVSIELGIASTIAIVLHEIPQEIGDFGVLIHAGYTRTRALVLNFLSALLAIFGAVIALIIGDTVTSFVPFILPFAAGSFIYIASSDLTPELHKETGLKETALQLFALLIGIGVMLLLLIFE